jgi:hypothetical protein
VADVAAVAAVADVAAVAAVDDSIFFLDLTLHLIMLMFKLRQL